MSTTPDPRSSEAVLEREKSETEHPKLYKVILLNDDYTPMEFVIEIMLDVFRKNIEEAVQLTMDIHQHGKGICGVFSKDIADMKQQQVVERAQTEGHPLKCVIEPEAPSSKPGGMKP